MTGITFEGWTAQIRECSDQVASRLIEQFKVTLDGQLYNDVPTPLGIHWCLGPELEPSGNLGLDGHVKLGGMLPPIRYPRRMWAGGALHISDIFQPGDVVDKTSMVTDIQHKSGSSGQLCFLTITHEFLVQNKKFLTEIQRLVFKEDSLIDLNKIPSKGEPEKLPESRVIKASFNTDPVLLFRYSALTFNGHRIHYDVTHAKTVEGQPAIVVHGPLQASWLLNMAARHLGAVPSRFIYKNLSPLFAGQMACLSVAEETDGKSLIVYCCDESGKITMKGEAFI